MTKQENTNEQPAEELDFSVPARSLIPVFNGVDCVIYVEGKNDVPFWEGLLQQHGNSGMKFEVKTLKDWKTNSPEGKKELLKYLPELTSGRLQHTIIAMDRDFDEFKGKLHLSPLILYTSGYSIENSFYTPLTISFFLYDTGDAALQLSHQFQRFHEEVVQFVPYLIAAQLCGKASYMPKIATVCQEILHPSAAESQQQLLAHCRVCAADEADNAATVAERISKSGLSSSYIIPGKCYYQWIVEQSKNEPSLKKSQSALSQKEVSAFCRRIYFNHPDKGSDDFAYYHKVIREAEAAVLSPP